MISFNRSTTTNATLQFLDKKQDMKHLILNKEKDIRACKEVQIRLLSSFGNTACHYVIHKRIGNILLIIDC